MEPNQLTAVTWGREAGAQPAATGLRTNARRRKIGGRNPLTHTVPSHTRRVLPCLCDRSRLLHCLWGRSCARGLSCEPPTLAPGQGDWTRSTWPVYLARGQALSLQMGPGHPRDPAHGREGSAPLHSSCSPGPTRQTARLSQKLLRQNLQKII